MRPEPHNRIDPRAISLWRIHAVIQLGFLSVGALVGYTSLFFGADLPVWSAAAFAAPLALYGALSVVVFPRVRWQVWRYALNEHELDLQHGLVVVHRTLIPLVRVQHVDTVQGPLAKLFHLSAVTVSTAASTHEIPALSDTVADELRDRISAMARQAREQL